MSTSESWKLRQGRISKSNTWRRHCKVVRKYSRSTNAVRETAHTAHSTPLVPASNILLVITLRIYPGDWSSNVHLFTPQLFLLKLRTTFSFPSGVYRARLLQLLRSSNLSTFSRFSVFRAVLLKRSTGARRLCPQILTDGREVGMLNSSETHPYPPDKITSSVAGAAALNFLHQIWVSIEDNI